MNTKDKISLGLLIGFYGLLMLVNVRYFPGDLSRTLIATASNVLTLGSAAMAMTLIVASTMQKVVGQRLPWDRVLRFYLLFGIIIWFFAIMYTHLDQVERAKEAAPASVETGVVIQDSAEKLPDTAH